MRIKSRRQLGGQLFDVFTTYLVRSSARTATNLKNVVKEAGDKLTKPRHDYRMFVICVATLRFGKPWNANSRFLRSYQESRSQVLTSAKTIRR